MMASAAIPFHSLKLKPFHFNTPLGIAVLGTQRRTLAFHSLSTFQKLSIRSGFNPAGVTRATSDGGGPVDATSHHSSSPDVEKINRTLPIIGDGYVGLFVRMLGLDHDPADREQAIVALWKYSLGGKKYIDAIMQFPGCINLTVNLLRSESSSTCEAAAGLLRSLASVNLYRDSVADSGAIEEIIRLLCLPDLAPEVKEQSMCTLWNLSADEKLRMKIANSNALPLVIKYLDDEDAKVKEAAGGVVANLALSHVNHKIMVEASVIPKLAKCLTSGVEGSKIIRKEAKNALLALAKDEFHRILIIEEGLVPVPMVGASAFKAFIPSLHSWPTLPDGTQIERTSREPSRFGASELLLGLNIDDKNIDIEEAKINAIVGRTQQQFLARIGAIEMEDDKISKSGCSRGQQLTLLPWKDGVARLVLILQLEDESALSRAAESIAEASINEHMRVAFMEAGALKLLVQLLKHDNEAVRSAVARALERLSISNVFCQMIDVEGAVNPLTNILKSLHTSESIMEKSLDILARILEPPKEMKKYYGGPVNGSRKALDGAKRYDISPGFNMAVQPISEGLRKDIMDPAFTARLVEILKSAAPNLQRKAASVLEFLTVTGASMVSIISVDIESALHSAFQQRILKEVESDVEGQQPEKYSIEVEEAGLVISAASRLLTKLLDNENFCNKINSSNFIKLLREILKSGIPLRSKDWVASCLVKLSSLSAASLDSESSVKVEVTLYETIPRLIDQLKFSFNPETKEAAVAELNRIVSEGIIDSTRAVAAKGGIDPLVKLIEEGSDRAVEASLAILYNLSMDSENHPAILAAGAVPALRRIVLSQKPQWTRALHLLRALPT